MGWVRGWIFIFQHWTGRMENSEDNDVGQLFMTFNISTLLCHLTFIINDFNDIVTLIIMKIWRQVQIIWWCNQSVIYLHDLCLLVTMQLIQLHMTSLPWELLIFRKVDILYEVTLTPLYPSNENLGWNTLSQVVFMLQCWSMLQRNSVWHGVMRDCHWCTLLRQISSGFSSSQDMSQDSRDITTLSTPAPCIRDTRVKQVSFAICNKMSIKTFFAISILCLVCTQDF